MTAPAALGLLAAVCAGAAYEATGNALWLLVLTLNLAFALTRRPR